ncbi:MULTISPECIES: CcoQ/FixQ family Cbb3-type cytochrome c oxidase assembly chaperone [Vibrio]|uniref:Cytochrome-c oxidase n=2 Tax=Vibrio TaxID=662 RepID=A0A1E5CM92_9VIBR|nr:MULTISPECIES: CcoQ/FixQ family Cbb3-type cytochrome c oxidase assembly chaperone [Vibrio]RBW65923.1 CcoQ/FixQ family Cbb3-type cytochrome c oxidase assembly chaperone [Vibrionales bacterium C3R12]MDN3696838.1 CcoQ/FixQ family Cbb3-type cytochrome c oxidase assembly chaperone [Vibrio cortegadensis]NOH84431.1 CcoQ/FixQ family Cbb3-type cytochrome c oxidase assembly chaperone [Vibrio sp. 03-59-1]OEE69480.1 cytochrome-c oxidase [Vibrio genomosp. F6 str. FF-238]TKF22346.1 CcoQ/FixQ family Cbb3-t
MDIITFQSIWTVTVFVCFIGVVWWAYGKSRKSRFDEAANLVFADEPKKEQHPNQQGVTK